MHFHTLLIHTYFKKIQTTLLKLLYQIGPKFFNVVDQHHYKIHSMVFVRRSRLYGTMCILDIQEYEGWWQNKNIMAPPRIGKQCRYLILQHEFNHVLRENGNSTS